MKAQGAEALPKDTTKKTSSVSPFLFGIQLAGPGLFGHFEIKLVEQVALRIEAGFGSMFGVNVAASPYYIIATSFHLEPRWYYFLEAEGQKNDGSFLTISLCYVPNWDAFYLPYFLKSHQINIIPKWGIKKTLWWDLITVEAGAGIGYRGFISDGGSLTSTLALEIHLRLGVTF